MPGQLRVSIEPADLAAAFADMSNVGATQYLIAFAERLVDSHDRYKSALAYQLVKLLKTCNPVD